MCTCKILRFISRAILGTLVALLLAALVFCLSFTAAQDWLMIAGVILFTIGFSWVILKLIYLATQRCDGDC